MTLKEIAKEAGVSVSTVSRVINSNNTKVASLEVRNKIWDIVRRTGYIPNTHAQNLKQGSDTGVNSHALACIFARSTDSPNELFFTTLARSVEMEAYKQNYIVKSFFTPFDLSSPESCRQLTDSDINGVVVLGRCEKNTLRFLKQHCRHLVITGLNGIDAKYDQILCDGEETCMCAMDYLVGLGHRHIGYIGETQNESRYAGYQKIIQKYCLPFDSSYIAPVTLSSSGGYDGAKMLLSRQPTLTAFLCANDLTAIGAMRAIQEAGLKIPDDISIISIDDLDTAQYLTPMLTTIHVPIEELGQMAAKTIIDRITGGHTLPMKVHLPFYLAKRDSCSQPRQG